MTLGSSNCSPIVTFKQTSQKYGHQKKAQHIWSESNIGVMWKEFYDLRNEKNTEKCLLTNHGEENRLPHLVNIVLFLDLEDNYASFWGIL